MSKVSKLKISSGGDLFSQVNVRGAVHKSYQYVNNGKSGLIVRLENQIVGYEYLEKDEKFVHRWRQNVTASAADQLWTFDLNADGNHEIILRDYDGLKVYKMTSGSGDLELVGKDELFHDAYGTQQTLSVGKFYSNQKFVGLMRRDKNKNINFYVFKGNCLGIPDCDLLQRFKNKLELSPAWENLETKFYLTALRKENPQEIFALRTQTGIEFYQFNSKYQLERVLAGSSLATALGPQSKDELILFGSITKQPYQDVLHLNSNGLHLYHFDTSTTDYTMTFDPAFSSASGWSSEHSESFFVSDFDDDQKSEIIFTSREGLTIRKFNENAKRWEVSTDATSVQQSLKFSKVIGSVSVNNKPIMLVQSADGSLRDAKVTTEIVTAKASTKNLSKINKNKNQKQPEDSISVYDIAQVPYSPLSSQSHLRWTEQWAENFEQKFLGSVPNADGFVAFTLPLMDVNLSQHLKVQLVLSYSDQGQDSNIVGMGWNIPLLTNHIKADYQCSVFDDDTIFTFFGLGQRMHLKREASKETSASIMRFSIPGQDDMKASYHRGANSHWVVETPTERFVYGLDKTNGAVQMNLSWESARCGKTDVSSLKQIPITWYIKEKLDKTVGKSIYYRYNVVNKSIVPGGATYTHSLSLKTISDDKRALVSLDYAPKTSKEISPIEVVNNGKVTFPVPLADDFYLAKVSVRTESFLQSFRLGYKVTKSGNERLLIGIDQLLENAQVEKILKLEYKETDSVLMRACDLPRGSTVTFDHTKLNRVIPKDSLVKKFPVGDNPSITPSADYKVIAFTRGKKIILRIHDGADSDAILDSPVGYEPFEHQVIAVTSSMILVFITSADKQEIVTFEKAKSGWLEKPKRYQVPKNAKAHMGEKFIAFVAPMDVNIKVFSWDPENAEAGLTVESIASPNNKPLLKTHSFGRILVSYDDSHLIIFYSNDKGKWSSKNVKQLGGFDAETRSTINKFDIDDDIKKQLLESVKENLLQVDGNQIVLTKLRESGGVISVVLHLMVLDSNYNVKEQVEVVHRENVFNLNHDETQMKTKFRMKYLRIDGKLGIRVVDIISGDILDQLNQVPTEHRSSERTRVLKEINGAAEWRKYFKNLFLLNWKLYHARLTPSGLLCGDDISFEMTGVKWERKTPKQEPESLSFKLGPKLVVEQSDPKVNELSIYETKFNQKNLVHKMKIAGEFANVFPAYLAYQSANDIKLLTVTPEMTIEGVETIEDAKLLQGDMNGMTMLVNSTSLAHAEPMEIHFRPLADFINSRAEYAISKKTLRSGGMQRVTSYERSFEVEQDGSLFEKFAMIPGGAKEKFGWYEESKSFNTTDKVVTRERKTFHATGELKGHEIIENQAKDSVEDDDDEKEDFSGKLMDRSRTLEIADITPHKVSDENYAYLGFESYEEPLIGDPEKKNKWRFPEQSIMRKGFFLTGESFLRLADHQKLEATIEPKNQNEIFVASCWVRTKSGLQLHQTTEIFEVALEEKSGRKLEAMPAKVKRQLGEWNYLEILVDFRKLSSEFEVSLTITNIDDPIDVDHILFARINQEFRAEVFNAFGQVTATIHPNAIIKRKLYNKYQQEIATIDEEANISELKSMTNTGKLLNNNSSKNRISQLTFKATRNQIYDPIEWWKTWKIDGVDDEGIWGFAPGQMWHKAEYRHQIVVSSAALSVTSNAIRFDYALASNDASIELTSGDRTLAMLSKSNDESELSVGSEKFKIPSSGEFVMAIEKSRTIVWVDGVQLKDFKSSSSLTQYDNLTLEIAGEVGMESFMSINNPSLSVEYFNSWGEPTQIINLEDENTAQVTEILHDTLGRRAITTKPTRITRNANEPLLAFYDDFVTNDNHEDSRSVWFTHHLDGVVNELNPKCAGFAYKRTEFEKNPSRDKQAVGQPGKEFSIVGPYSKKIKSTTDLPFLLNLFPVTKGFTMYTRVLENGSKKVSVYDVGEKKVADYVRVPGFDHILSINEYDLEGRIVKILPPLYHEKAGTMTRQDPWQFGEDHLSEDELKLQKAFGSHFTYDDDGNLINKSTSDGGKVEFVYDEEGNRRFTKLASGQVVYFIYNDAEMMIETGHLHVSLDLEALETLAKSTELPDHIQRTTSQEFGYTNEADDPQERRATKKFVTHSHGKEISDEASFNTKDDLVKKVTKASNEPSMNIEKTYEMGKLSTLTYPKSSTGEDELNLVYKYDKRGHLTSIGTVDNPSSFAKFTYTVDGQLESETVQPNSQHEFIRTFDYQTAGYLEKIHDPFITEEMTFTSNGYGQKGFGDGILSSTTFRATWSESADPNHFKPKLEELVGDKKLLSRCFKILKQAGYLTDGNVIEKPLTFKTESKLPVQCKGKVGYQLEKLIAKRQRPKVYGHRYAYGNHKELTKAKYFADEASMKLEALQAGTFAEELSNLRSEDSHEIWRQLVKNKFIVTDQRNADWKSAIGKQGVESFVKLSEIEDELKTLSSPSFDELKVVPEIANLIVKMISKKQFATEASFQKDFLAMHGFDESSTDWQVEQLKQTSIKIFTKLSAKNLLPIYPKLLDPLNPKLFSSLRKFASRVPEIIKVLNAHWTSNIGESPFDSYSFDIDSNGNQRLFYNGFQRYEFDFQPETNKIKSIKLEDITTPEPQKNFAIEHDADGNIIKALHRNIENIEYFITTQRTKQITMTDGRVLKFFYDAMGERILKQVFGASGELQSSMKYVRDEKGQVLADVKTIYQAKPQMPKKIYSKYIYGPRGLFGFIRNREFFSVTTDHIGSIRLVIRNGQVVASYDYLPYGELMRKFVSNPEHEIAYRFTGQEFDEETGLYNYHARLYDPSIGRFYQLDPQAQYFSPYIYGGNSPISGTDPDGEFFFTLVVIGLAVGGGFLAGAKHNNSWNPTKWNWKDPRTYLSMGTGALAGATLPFTAVSLGLTGSLVAGGVGIFTGYIKTSVDNKSLNPGKWDWSSPTTYAGFFDGFSMGFNIVDGISTISTMSKTMTIPFFGKTISGYVAKSILPVTIAGGVGFAYYKGAKANEGDFAFWNWRWDAEGMTVTFGEMLDGFSTVVSLSSTVTNLNFLQIKGSTNLAVTKTLTNSNKIKNFLKKSSKITAEVTAGIIAGFVKVNEADGFDEIFDFENFKFNEISTYEKFFNGFLEGRALVSESVELRQKRVQMKKSKKTKSASTLQRKNAMRIPSEAKPTLTRQNAMRIPNVPASSTAIRPSSTAIRPSTPNKPQRSNTFRRKRSDEEFDAFLHKEAGDDDHEDESMLDYDAGAPLKVQLNFKSLPYRLLHELANVETITNGTAYNDSTSSTSFNVLEMGDSFLQKIDTVGNLTLLNLLAEKFFKTRRSLQKRSDKEWDVEYHLMTSEIVNAFVEKFLEIAEICGLSKHVINEIIETVDLSELNRLVESALRKKQLHEVTKLLKDNVLLANVDVIQQNTSNDEIAMLIMLTEKELEILEGRLDGFMRKLSYT